MATRKIQSAKRKYNSQVPLLQNDDVNGNATKKADVDFQIKKDSSNIIGHKDGFLTNMMNGLRIFLGFRTFVLFVYISFYQNYLEYISKDYDGYRTSFISSRGLGLAILYGIVVPSLRFLQPKQESPEEIKYLIEAGQHFGKSMALQWELLLDCAVSFLSYLTFLVQIFRKLFHRFHELSAENTDEVTLMHSGMVEATFVYAIVGMMIMRQWGFYMPEMTGKNAVSAKFYVIFNLFGFWCVIKHFIG